MNSQLAQSALLTILSDESLPDSIHQHAINRTSIPDPSAQQVQSDLDTVLDDLVSIPLRQAAINRLVAKARST